MFTSYIKNKGSHDMIISKDRNQGKTLCSVSNRETGGNKSSKQERDDDIKTIGASLYGSLRARCLS
jgi:hypothetical protein